MSDRPPSSAPSGTNPAPSSEPGRPAAPAASSPAQLVHLGDMAGLPVVAADTARQLGEVHGFVVDRSGTTVTKVHVGGKRRKAVFVPWSALTIGPDVVMAASADTAGAGTDDRDQHTARGDLTLVGARVLDTAGMVRGTVTAGAVEPGTGRLVELRLDGTTVRPQQIRGFGRYALVVDAALERERR